MQHAELVAQSEDLNLKCSTVAEGSQTSRKHAEKTRAGENRRKRRNTPLYQPDPNLRERQ